MVYTYQQLGYWCLLGLLNIIVGSQGNVFNRNRDFDDLFKGAFESVVFKTSGSGPCGLYATGSLYSSFFFNEISQECRLIYGIFSDVTQAVSNPGNRYFVKETATRLTQVCSTVSLADGFSPDISSGLCYKVFDGVNIGWTEAKDKCEQNGYQLVVLDTLAKAQTLAAMLTASAEHTEDGYWIGLSDPAGWVDSSTFSDTYWWTTGQFLEYSYCVRLDRGSDYKWKNDHCNSARSYICQAA